MIKAFSFGQGRLERSEGTWLTHAEPFRLLTKEQEQSRMNAPKALLGGTLSSLRITWRTATAKAAEDDDDGGYELQMRENKPGMEWTTIASSIKGTEVRKKNLTSAAGYQFRVRPATVGERTIMTSHFHLHLTQWSLSGYLTV